MLASRGAWLVSVVKKQETCRFASRFLVFRFCLFALTCRTEGGGLGSWPAPGKGAGWPSLPVLLRQGQPRGRAPLPHALYPRPLNTGPRTPRACTSIARDWGPGWNGQGERSVKQHSGGWRRYRPVGVGRPTPRPRGARWRRAYCGSAPRRASAVEARGARWTAAGGGHSVAALSGARVPLGRVRVGGMACACVRVGPAQDRQRGGGQACGSARPLECTH